MVKQKCLNCECEIEINKDDKEISDGYICNSCMEDKK